MSQLADIEGIVRSTPLPQRQRASLFLSLIEALGWEVDGVSSVDDAEVYLFGDYDNEARPRIHGR